MSSGCLVGLLGSPGWLPGPVFRFMNGLPLTHPEFVSRVKTALQSLGYPAKDFAGHSFRAGAASTAAAMGIQDSVIKAPGRWESSAYLLYTQLP